MGSTGTYVFAKLEEIITHLCSTTGLYGMQCASLGGHLLGLSNTCTVALSAAVCADLSLDATCCLLVCGRPT